MGTFTFKSDRDGKVDPAHRHCRKVALDTEADSLHNYFEKVCLVQLSFGGEHYLIPLAGRT